MKAGPILRNAPSAMTQALLVIDIQHALCNGEEAAHDIDAVVERINTLSCKAHAAGLPIFLIQHEEPEGPLQYGAPGWQLDGRLTVWPDDLHLRKTATDAFHQTALHAQLKERKIDRVVICGLQSEFCIDSTVRGALAHGYPVTLVADAHSTIDNGVISAAQISAHHNATLRNLGAYGPRVTVLPAAEVSFVG